MKDITPKEAPKWNNLSLENDGRVTIEGDYWITAIKMSDHKDSKFRIKLDGEKSPIIRSVVHTKPKQVSVIAAKGADVKILKVEGGMKLLMNGEDIVAVFKEEETAPPATQIKKM